MVKKINAINTLYSTKDYKEFNDFYRKTALNFIASNQLAIKDEYYHRHGEDYHVVNIDDLKQKNSYGNSSSENILKTTDQIANHIKCDFPKQNLHWLDFLPSFYLYLYKASNPIHRNMLQHFTIMGEDLKDVSEYLSKDTDLLIDYINNSKHLYKGILQRAWLLNNLVEVWKKAFPNEVFNEVIADFFTTHKNMMSKKEVIINVNYILSAFVDDESILNEIKKLLPEKSANSFDLFISNDINIFEVFIDKNKLTQFITLKDKERYNDMYEHTAELLNKHCKDLDIISITIPEKFKSAKEYRILVKLEKNSRYNEEKFKKLLLSVYKGYESLMLSGIHQYQMKEHMTFAWIQKCHLTDELSNKETTLIKKNKI